MILSDFLPSAGSKSNTTTAIRNTYLEPPTSLTASDMVYRRLLKRLGKDYLTEDGERHAVVTFPINFLDLPRVKAKRELDPSRRAKLAAQMAERRKLSRAVKENGLS